MIVYIDRLLEEFVSPALRNTDYKKHVLQKTENSPNKDFINQDYDIGKVQRPLYPMFPYMSEEEYEQAADDLRLSNANGFINYNLNITRKDGGKNVRPRAVKYREINLPATPHDNEFYEMVVYSLSDDKVIGYYLCTAKRIGKEKSKAVYYLNGKPVKYNTELIKELKQNPEAWEEVQNYFNSQQKAKFSEDDISEDLDEAYSSPQGLTDRFGKIIGFIQTDNNTGQQMLTDRFGKIVGWYNQRTNITVDRFGKVVGFGNILPTLLLDKDMR